MSNIPASDLPIDPFSIGGTELVTRLNRLNDAICSGHLSNIRPPLISAGGLWSRANPDASHSLVLYDGVADAVVDTYGADTAPKPDLSQIAAPYGPTSNYTMGQVVFNSANGRFEQAKTNVSAGPYNPNQWLALGGFRDAFQPMPLPVPDLPGPIFREFSVEKEQATLYGASASITGAVLHSFTGRVITFGPETGAGYRYGAAIFFAEASFSGPSTGAEYFMWNPVPALGQQLFSAPDQTMTILRRQSNGVTDMWVGSYAGTNGMKSLLLTTEGAFKKRTVHNNCRFAYEIPFCMYSQA